MSLSGSERSVHSDQQPRQPRTRRRKLFRKRDKRSRSSERYEFSDLEDDVFVRGPRKLRREDVEGELSYDYSNPGSLKVFTAGLNRCAGLPEFRTVLLSAVATAADVINDVLQRCDILYEDGDEFFLCEVIGKMEPYQPHHARQSGHQEPMQFVEQCRRIIGPEEHVLVIQALWKPLYGYYRRFELKQVSPAEAKNSRRRQDRRRRRRVQLWRSGDYSRHYDLDDSDSADDRQLHEGTPPKRLRCQVATQVEPGDPPTQTRGRTRGCGTQTETVYFPSVDRRSSKKYPVPLGPYLLLVKGFDTRNDLLVNDLYDMNLLGSDDRKCDIHLRCADVQPKHCVIEACHSEVGDDDTAKDSKPYCMSLSPVGNAEVLLNGQLIDRKHFLSPGDVISIGAGEMCSYVFMFKDTSQVPDRSIGLTWLMFLESAQRSIDLQQLLEDSGAVESERRKVTTAAAAAGSFVSTTVPSDSVLDTPRDDKAASLNSAAREVDTQQLTQASLGSVLALYFGEAVDLQFAAGLFVLLTVYVADLELEHAGAEIQWHITDSAVTLAKKANQMEDRRDKAQCYSEMIRACALAFEIFLFFHEACGVGLTAAAVRCQHWRDFCETTMQQMLDRIFSQLGEEVLAESAALCDTGLGSASEPSGTGPTMGGFLTLLTQVSRAFTNMQYQCVSTLRLMIMKRLVFQIGKHFTQRLFGTDPTNFLKWNCAVQLRVNLDQLEEWLRQEGLEQFIVALDLPNSIVDLLATPKSLLMSTPWQRIRTNYPLIPASLLRRILLEYESRTGPVNGLWSVPDEDSGEVAYDVDCAIEDHFQLAIVDCQIPVEKVRPSVQLRSLLKSPEFNQLLLHMDNKTGASNCQLQWHHVANHIRDRLGSPSSAQSPLGSLFTTSPKPAASNTPSAAGAAAADTDMEEDTNNDEAQQQNFYDSLSEDEPNESSRRSPVELRLDDETDELISKTVKAAGAMPAFTKPQTLQYGDQGELEVKDEDIDEELSIGIDPFTLANTLRNEMHAHYVQSESGGSGDESTLPRNQQQNRPSCPLSFFANGSSGFLGDQSNETESTISGGGNGSLSATNEALYRQHTMSFVSSEPVATPVRQLSKLSLPSRSQRVQQQQHQLEEVQLPPPPPPRSWSLNNRRTQIEHSQEMDVRSAGDEEPDLFFVTLSRRPGQSFGMELIDGEKSPLVSPGVYIRSVVADTPADRCHRLCPGDRIIAVNNESLVNRPYAKCLGLIKSSESVLQLLVARSPPEIAVRVLATASR
uniref:Ras-associating domain-containing protein n=2 Tax=Macrostomum lignano TaxID=282301 RepID=A0A1I8J0H7_9PLAT